MLLRLCKRLYLLVGQTYSSRGQTWLDWLNLWLSVRHILFYKVLLKLWPWFAVVSSVINVENKLFGTDSFHELFELTVVAVRTVRHFVVKRHISVVFVIPTGQNDKYCWLLFVTFVYTIYIYYNIICLLTHTSWDLLYAWREFERLDHSNQLWKVPVRDQATLFCDTDLRRLVL